MTRPLLSLSSRLQIQILKTANTNHKVGVAEAGLCCTQFLGLRVAQGTNLTAGQRHAPRLRPKTTFEVWTAMEEQLRMHQRIKR